MDGILITLEAGEGVKKLPLLMTAAEFLMRNGLPVLCTREPGAERSAEAFRRLLETAPEREEVVMSELVYVFSGRMEHFDKVLKPAIDAGFVVVCDRFVHSTLAYQGRGGGARDNLIRSMHADVTGDLWPDLTLYFDLPAEETMARLAQKRESTKLNKFESRGLEFHERVRRGFLDMAANPDENGAMIVIDADRPTAEIEVDVIHHLSQWFRHG